MKIALVHDWLTGMRGGEKVLRALCEVYPEADLFTLIHSPGSCGEVIERRKINTSWLNRLPGVGRYYRHLLPLMPRAIESLDLRGYQLIISSSHCVAKGIIKDEDAVHVCYCHTPMRYLWAQDKAYQQNMSLLNSVGLKLFSSYLKRWDQATADRVDHFIANSHNVAERIEQIYHRKASVIHPPVDTDFYQPTDEPREEYYLVLSALAPYKKIEQAIEACRLLHKKLVIIGSGQQEKQLRTLANDDVTFLGWVDDQTIHQHLCRCRALLFPGEEDFGIVPVEAMACGTPVIAYDAGGARETVCCSLTDSKNQSPTGLRYSPQTAPALADAIQQFEQQKNQFNPQAISDWANRFNVNRFKSEVRQLIDECYLVGQGLP